MRDAPVLFFLLCFPPAPLPAFDSVEGKGSHICTNFLFCGAHEFIGGHISFLFFEMNSFEAVYVWASFVEHRSSQSIV
jgi:hypothetical protein